MAHDGDVARALTQSLLRRIGTGGLFILVSLGSAGRVGAMYLYSDYPDGPVYAECENGPQAIDIARAVGFADGLNTDWYNSGPAPVVVLQYPILYLRSTAGDYIDRARYYYLDKGQYYYLDKGQYNLLGGLGYLSGRLYDPARYEWDFHQFSKAPGHPAPEPSVIGFVTLGALSILVFGRRRSYGIQAGEMKPPS